MGLLRTQVRSNGQAKDSGGEFFGDGQFPGVRCQRSEVGVGAGEMRGHGVMDQGADARLAELLLNRVTLRVADHEEMPDGVGPGGDERQNQLRVES